ncbi:hypothetical protein V8F06_009669 [Rhypophila decipiens]
MSSGSSDAPVPPDYLSIVERSCSVFSLLGCIFIISTFCLDKAFRKPINRLVFYASFGNLMTNVATLMARSFIGDVNSAGCQFQAFMIQMFMPADALWTMAMALNVYLTFYHKFDAQRLRKMDTAYLITCYGIPFIIAFTYIFISTPKQGRFYGNAVLWCWVSQNWDIMRIATFYGPVWIVTLITFFIYLRAGSDIYKRHKQLRDFSSTTHHEAEMTTNVPSSVGADSFSSSKTTEVLVTTEVVNQDDALSGGAGGPSSSLGRNNSQPSPSPQNTTAPFYSVTISASSNNRRQSDVLPIQTNRPTTAIRPIANNPNPRRRAAYEANSAILSYTKCALLFFTAMLVTWIPSSANRVYSVVHESRTSLMLEYMSAAVLPLQGFWNAIIYAVTSWGAVKMLFNGYGYGNGVVGSGGMVRMGSSRTGGSSFGMRTRRTKTGPKIQELVGVRIGAFQGLGSAGGGGNGSEKFSPGFGGLGLGLGYDSSGESTTELAAGSPSLSGSRPSSN